MLRALWCSYLLVHVIVPESIRCPSSIDGGSGDAFGVWIIVGNPQGLTLILQQAA